MSANRELSQFGSFIEVDDTTKTIGISTDVTISGNLFADNIDGLLVPPGKTIYVAKNGSDDNTGLTENEAKLTIKSAVSIAMPGDTVVVFPGQYIEDNPIIVKPIVTIRGTELRNCIVTPKNTNRDIFSVCNGVHITDFSFIGPQMTDGSSVVSFRELTGVSTDRYFDAARMIRYNLDFISGEAVGYLTSTDYRNPPFEIVDSQSNPIDPSHCRDDIKDILKAVCYDITRGGNVKSIGAGLTYYSGSTLQHINGVKQETIDAIYYSVGIAVSCINNVSWNGNYQNQFSQVKDISIQPDSLTESNVDINSCADVVSSMYSCIGIVTSIINIGPNALSGTGIVTSYPGNAGVGVSNFNSITSANYDSKTGNIILSSPAFPVKRGDIVEVKNLIFNTDSGTEVLPSGKYGYEFIVDKTYNDGSFKVNIGIGTTSYTSYVGGGHLVNRFFDVDNAIYDNTTGIVTITSSSDLKLRVGDFVNLRDLEFTCTSGAATTTLYPTGKYGFDFPVESVSIVGGGSQIEFSVNVGTSTISHAYSSGGKILSPYSPGVGKILQGPYIRNCTNFIPDSIGMKVDGFSAEPGDQDDIGVTGSMSVDSYTQYNQNGIGVSITNGAYAQLVSIFTICNDTAIYTSSGGQCDITNSNSSFGKYALVSDGVGDENTKSIYRYSASVKTATQIETDELTLEGIGPNRPYTGQVFYIDELYYQISDIIITNQGSGYTSPPVITISAPTGPQAIRAEAFATLVNGKLSTINIIGNGRNYRLTDNVQINITGGGGVGAAAQAVLSSLYYKVASATPPTSGISTITIAGIFNNNISVGSTCYFSRQSLQIVSSHSFEFIGSGTSILTARPAMGGVTIKDNEIIKINGGEIVYTSTDQDGNFSIGDDVIINQTTGTIDGRAFEQSLINTVTPLIIALGGI